MTPRKFIADEIEGILGRVMRMPDDDGTKTVVAAMLSSAHWALTRDDEQETPNTSSKDDMFDKLLGDTNTSSSREPRDLRAEMAPEYGPRKRKRRRPPFVEQPAPELGDFVEVEDDGGRCECGGPYHAHAVLESAEPRRGLQAHLLCDQRSVVYCPRRR